MTTKRSYSEEEKAEALALLNVNGGNVNSTAKQLHMPVPTLRKWANGKHINNAVLQKEQQKKQSLAELFEEVARAYIARALDLGAIDDTRGKDAVIAAATALDKLQLLIGAPTARSQIQVIDMPDLPDDVLDTLLSNGE